MRTFLFILICFGLSIIGQAQNTSELFQSANQAYEDGNYEIAITNYHAILDQGVESADLYYNMGNAYYKSTNIPSAILYYEKCLKIDRSHEDAHFNLQLANLRIADRIEAQPALFLNSFIQKTVSINTSSGWGKWFILALFSALIGLFLFLLSKHVPWRKFGFILGLSSIFGAVVLFFIAQSAFNAERNSNQAILFATNEYVKASPDASSTDLFILHEGVKVSIKDEIGEWVNIKLADGKEGWVPKISVEPI